MTVVLCMVLLCGCSGKSKYAGVYNGPYGAKIVLFEDGTCDHLGDDASWKVRAGNLTITREYPDKYYLDVYMDITAQEWSELYRSYKTFGWIFLFTIENIDTSNVADIEYFAFEGRLRIELKEKDKDNALKEALLDVEYIDSVKNDVEKGSTKEYEYKIAGNTIVTGFGDYIKQ